MGEPSDEESGDQNPSDGESSGQDPSDEEVVQTAAEAAQGYVFSRLSKSDVTDIDVTVSFEDGVLDVEVYVNAPDADEDVERIADDAALVAGQAVDDLFESA